MLISRKFVQLMQGDIAVTSEPGRGTRVRFDIQAAVVETQNSEQAQPIRQAIAVAPGQPRLRLLIVDDKGCTDFLRKPFRDDEVFAMMHTHLGVQFVYAEPAAQLPQASMDSQETEAALAMLREVSPGLLVQLEEAATCCNISQVDQIIAEMRRHHPAFADVLMSFAREFDYVKIVSTIHGAGHAACSRVIT